MKRRPIIKKHEEPAPEGVTKTRTTKSYRSDNKKNHMVGEVMSITITNETPVDSCRKVMPEKIGSTIDDELEDMKIRAVKVLEAAGFPTHWVKTEEILDGKKQITSKSPVSMTEPYTDEWHAANVLRHVDLTKRAIKDDNAESAAQSAFRATRHYTAMVIDHYAYAIGLERTKKGPGKHYIEIAEKIRKEQKISTSELQNDKRKGSSTISYLAERVLDEMDKNDLPLVDVSTVRRALLAHYGKS
jgi:hypothetical protein